ncbi:MAG: hypothetical protein KatS3mg022_2803 [Armatimonadota bacterium]|nr:MAG: hypothetical protein KatS3mg022_2803 [Armatimonadota bacterium]
MREAAEEAGEKLARQGAQKAAQKVAEEATEIAWRTVGREEMEKIVHLGRFVPSKNPIAGTRGVFTRIATSYEKVVQWGVAGRSTYGYEYVVGIPLRKGTILEAIRRQHAFGDSAWGYIISVRFMNRRIAGQPIVIPLPTYP